MLCKIIIIRIPIMMIMMMVMKVMAIKTLIIRKRKHITTKKLTVLYIIPLKPTLPLLIPQDCIIILMKVLVTTSIRNQSIKDLLLLTLNRVVRPDTDIMSHISMICIILIINISQLIIIKDGNVVILPTIPSLHTLLLPHRPLLLLLFVAFSSIVFL
jgi:hypothetical protein